MGYANESATGLSVLFGNVQCHVPVSWVPSLLTPSLPSTVILPRSWWLMGAVSDKVRRESC